MRVAAAATLCLVLLACRPSPLRLVLESPTLTPASFAGMSAKAAALCDEASSAAPAVTDHLQPGLLPAGSLAEFGRGDAYGSPGEWKLLQGQDLQLLRAASPEDVRALLCVDQVSVTVGQYGIAPGDTSGPRAIRRDYEARLVSWPDGRVLARMSAGGSAPPSVIAGSAAGWREVGGAGNPPLASAAAGYISGSDRSFEIGRWAVTALADPSILMLGDKVNEIAFSPDGRLLAAASGRDSALWDIASGRELHRWPEPAAHVAFDANAAILMTSGVLRDLATGSEISRLPEDGTFSKDGRLLATGSSTGLCCSSTVTFRNPANGAVRRSLERNQGAPRAFAPDSRRLACAAWDGITVIDAENGEWLHRVRGYQNEPGVAWSPDGAALAVSGLPVDGTRGLRLWRTADWTEEFELVGAGREVAFFPDGRHLALGAGEGTVVWDLTARKTVRALLGQGPPTAIAVSPDGKTVATGDVYGLIKLWDVAATAGR